MSKKDIDKRFLEAIDAEDNVLEGDWKQIGPLVNALAEAGVWFMVLSEEDGFVMRFVFEDVVRAMEAGEIVVRYAGGEK